MGPRFVGSCGLRCIYGCCTSGSVVGPFAFSGLHQRQCVFKVINARVLTSFNFNNVLCGLSKGFVKFYFVPDGNIVAYRSSYIAGESE